MFSVIETSEHTANHPNMNLQTRTSANGALIIRQVVECAASAALWLQGALPAAPYPPLRRYRVTPRRNPRVFRREMLGELVRQLKANPTPTANG
jgi:hypothetical protein